MFYGKMADKNPWDSTTLEWTAEVKHIHGNWDGPIPEVHRWSYDYSKLNKDNSDYVLPDKITFLNIFHFKIMKIELKH